MLHAHPTTLSQPQPERDRGAVLILTLLLTIVLAAVVLALATYATAGLAASKVTTGRNESNAAASSGIQWYLEELAKKTISDDCTVEATGDTPVVPAAIGDVSVACTVESPIDDHPAVRLVATATVGEATRVIDVVVQVPVSAYTVQVHSWSAE